MSNNRFDIKKAITSAQTAQLMALKRALRAFQKRNALTLQVSGLFRKHAAELPVGDPARVVVESACTMFEDIANGKKD